MRKGALQKRQEMALTALLNTLQGPRRSLAPGKKGRPSLGTLARSGGKRYLFQNEQPLCFFSSRTYHVTGLLDRMTTHATVYARVVVNSTPSPPEMFFLAAHSAI